MNYVFFTAQELSRHDKAHHFQKDRSDEAPCKVTTKIGVFNVTLWVIYP
jgi:hypothetical protein